MKNWSEWCHGKIQREPQSAEQPDRGERFHSGEKTGERDVSKEQRLRNCRSTSSRVELQSERKQSLEPCTWTDCGFADQEQFHWFKEETLSRQEHLETQWWQYWTSMVRLGSHEGGKWRICKDLERKPQAVIPNCVHFVLWDDVALEDNLLKPKWALLTWKYF